MTVSEVDVLSDVAHEREQARELLREALTLLYDDLAFLEWLGWSERAEEFLRESQEGEQ